MLRIEINKKYFPGIYLAKKAIIIETVLKFGKQNVFPESVFFFFFL